MTNIHYLSFVIMMLREGCISAYHFGKSSGPKTHGKLSKTTSFFS